MAVYIEKAWSQDGISEMTAVCRHLCEEELTTMSCPLNKLFDLEGISHQRGQINQMYSNFLIISTNLRETGGIPSATTNE